MDPGEMALLIPILALMIPIVAIWTKHQQKMAEIKAMQGTALAPNVRAELNQLREEIATLRETTTRFDMSFDAALTHLEDRMDKADSLPSVAEPLRAPAASPVESKLETLSVGR